MRLLVTGRSGQVATALLAAGRQVGVEVAALGRPDLDLTEPKTIARAIDRVRPDLLVNPAAFTAVDKAENEPEAARAVNAAGAGHVAKAAVAAGLPVIHISTDYVFSGDKLAPYTEADVPDPVGAYGRSKLEGEEAVAAANPAHAILRTAWVYGPDGHNFVKTMLRLASERDDVRVVADQHGTPTYAPDIAAAILVVARHVLVDPAGIGWRGVFHMVAAGETTWAGLAEAVFTASAARGGPHARVVPISTADYPTPARRPSNSRLDMRRFRSTFGHALPHWQDGVERCVAAILADRERRS